MKKIRLCLLLFVFLLVGCTTNSSDKAFSIVSTSFPGYDFARAITDDKSNTIMLIKPGTEVHTFDPSPKDIINIQNSDVFIYVGGESDAWVDDILSTLDTSNMVIVRLMDYVDLSYEEIKEGMTSHDSEEEYDEHIWTSPKNAIKLVNAIYDAILEKDNNNTKFYKSNKDKYVKSLEDLDKQITDIVSKASRKTLIFGDRFPFKYFVNDYGLDYYAAFPGCSSETEPSAKTVSFLIDKVKKEKIPVIFYLEMSSKRQASLIAEETGAKILMFHSIHNLTKKEFESNLTYVDLMKQNISNLKEALK